MAKALADCCRIDLEAMVLVKGSTTQIAGPFWIEAGLPGPANLCPNLFLLNCNYAKVESGQGHRKI